MNNGMVKAILLTSALLLSVCPVWAAEIYKVVDKDGNVVYTDQPPADGSLPMDLPELSVIETDQQSLVAPAAGDATAAAKEASGPSPRELSRMYGDFSITQPQNEETFWGTANTVVVSWGSSIPPAPDMSVRLFVDGQPQAAPSMGSVSLFLDRGEHKVYAELLDARNRRIVVTDTVTFFVNQASVGFNSPGTSLQPGA
jgi:hypothetical protein